jgi:hypothetical protein
MVSTYAAMIPSRSGLPMGYVNGTLAALGKCGRIMRQVSEFDPLTKRDRKMGEVWQI